MLTATGFYDAPHLARNGANFTALTPLNFLARAAAIHPDKVAVVHGATRFTYSEFYDRSRQFADSLRRRGIKPGDTVAVIAPNIPALLEAHYGVPMAGGVLNAINCHLDAKSIASILVHGEAKLLIVDRELIPVVKAAFQELESPVPLVEIDDVSCSEPSKESLGGTEYEAFLAEGDPAAIWAKPSDEWEPIALNYTSGTTGHSKGVVYHHRGALLNALSNVITFGISFDSVFLWTLPMFHCNGWMYTWAVTAVAATHVCMRRVDPASVFDAIAENQVTHLCGAPIVLNLLVHAPASVKRRFDQVVEVATGGAAPPAAVIEAMEQMGFRVTHLYGLTESFGPCAVCAWQEAWADLPMPVRAARMARQGVTTLSVDRLRIVHPATMTDVPDDGRTLGELLLRSNTLMRGYLKDPVATKAAFEGGWFHTGDLAVSHPDGYFEIKDRTKDIIIVGGDNVSSLEVENILYRHPQIMEAAVVARNDAIWGEIPCAFVTLRPGADLLSANDIVTWCRANLAEFKVPRCVVFGPLPKTSTGKIQKFELRERARDVLPVLEDQPKGDLTAGDTLERELQRICERVLRISPIEWSQSLPEHCDSLTLLTLFTEIAERLKCDAKFGAFFACPTIAGLASVIRGTEASGERKIRSNRPRPHLRPAYSSDVAVLCKFLHEGFKQNGVPFSAWSRLFDYKWLDSKPDLGLVLTVSDKIVGFVGKIYASRNMGQNGGVVCNLTSWYVLPEFRGWAGELLAAAVSDESVTFTAFTPEAATIQMLEALGFAKLYTRKLILPPLLQAGTFRERGMSVAFDLATVRQTLDQANREMLDDHIGCDCMPLTLRSGSEDAFIIVKRCAGGHARLNRLISRYIKTFSTNTKVPYSEVLYCSNPGFLARHLERAKLAILRRQRTFLLVCDERLFSEQPKGLWVESPALYRSPLSAVGRLDKLYSELVLLPSDFRETK
jgi:fatty-acyl-CoA synthase